jgi:hypothetical protein
VRLRAQNSWPGPGCHWSTYRADLASGPGRPHVSPHHSPPWLDRRILLQPSLTRCLYCDRQLAAVSSPSSLASNTHATERTRVGRSEEQELANMRPYQDCRSREKCAAKSTLGAETRTAPRGAKSRPRQLLLGVPHGCALLSCDTENHDSRLQPGSPILMPREMLRRAGGLEGQESNRVLQASNDQLLLPTH